MGKKSYICEDFGKKILKFNCLLETWVLRQKRGCQSYLVLTSLKQKCNSIEDRMNNIPLTRIIPLVLEMALKI